MTSILLMAVGLILVIWPPVYTITLLKIVSGFMIIAAVVMILEYMQSKKSLMDYVRLTGALILGIAGMLFMIFDMDALVVISWIFGILLIFNGLYGGFYSIVFCRRSGKKGWWILIPLSLILVFFGVMIIINPWWYREGVLLNVIGLMTIIASVISAFRLIWVWPLKGE